MYTTAVKCEWNFSIYNHESISEEKKFTRFLIKSFLLKYISRIKDQISIENDVNDYVRWTRNLKTYVWKENREKNRTTRQIIKIKPESWGNG